MILLLGQNKYVEKYAKEILKIDMWNDIVYYPGNTTHYSEYEKCVEDLKECKAPVVTSQNIEFIEFLLNSDLNFDVITVIEDNNVRKLSKSKAKEVREEMGLELR